jgi:hypothetical protein
MHRRGLLVAVVLGALALTGVMSAAAQAAPEYGTCVKAAPKNTGHYSDSACQDEVAGTGKYEWVPGPGAKPGYSSKSKTTVFGAPDGDDLRCRASTDAGAVTGVTSAVDTITLTGCESEGQPCTSEGQAPGTVRTFELLSTLEELDGRAVVGYAGNGPLVDGEHLIVEFVCRTSGASAVLGRIRGVTRAAVSPLDVMSAKESLTFAGEENLLTEVSLDEGTEWGAPFRVELNTVITNKGAARAEIRRL